MRIGAVFSQADAGVDPVAIRQWARDVESAGFEHILAYDHILGASAEKLGPGPFGSFPHAPCTDQHNAGRDPASLNIHGRVYLGGGPGGGDGWQAGLEEALELGCSDCSIGFNRLAFPGRSHAEHLDAIVGAKEQIDAIVGRSS